MPVVRVGQGIPTVLLHGLGSDALAMEHDIGELAGLELMFPDQRGHGRNDTAALDPHIGLDDFVVDLAALLRALQLDHPVVGGGSMGAAVALRWALSTPDVARALVLIAPAVTDEPATAAPMFAGIAARIDSIGMHAAVKEIEQTLVDCGVPREQASAGLAPWLRQDSKSLTNLMRAVGTWTAFADTASLTECSLPVVVIGIVDDPIHPLEVAQRLHASLPRSDLQVVPLAKAHEPSVMGRAIRSGLERLGVV